MGRKVTHNVEILLNDELETFYWMGMLLSDGCFSDESISLSCNDKDLQHIIKFSLYINKSYITVQNKGGFSKVYKNMISVCAKSKEYFYAISEKFDIKRKKTYNPPDTSKWNFTEDQIAAMFIGFLDGDGCIMIKDKYCFKFNIHKSWIDVMIFFANVLNNKFKTNLKMPIISNRGMCWWSVSRIKILTDLKKFIVENNIPANERKWNKVDENKKSLREDAKVRNSSILELYKSGKTRKEIAKTLSIPEHIVYNNLAPLLRKE